MKVTRIYSYACIPYGIVTFRPVCSGFEAQWSCRWPEQRSAGFTDHKPSSKLARFFARKAIAEDRGLPPYIFTDSNTDPAP